MGRTCPRRRRARRRSKCPCSRRAGGESEAHCAARLWPPKWQPEGAPTWPKGREKGSWLPVRPASSGVHGEAATTVLPLERGYLEGGGWTVFAILWRHACEDRCEACGPPVPFRASPCSMRVRVCCARACVCFDSI